MKFCLGNMVAKNKKIVRENSALKHVVMSFFLKTTFTSTNYGMHTDWLKANLPPRYKEVQDMSVRLIALCTLIIR